jgi:tetratricopeptide (TPR) repeat protein
MIAWAKLYLKNYKEALAFFEQTLPNIKNEARIVETYEGLIKASSALKQYKKAARYGELLLANDTRLDAPRFTLIRLYQHTGNKKRRHHHLRCLASTGIPNKTGVGFLYLHHQIPNDIKKELIAQKIKPYKRLNICGKEFAKYTKWFLSSKKKDVGI